MITIAPAKPQDIDPLIALDNGASAENGRVGDIRNWVAVRQCHIATENNRPVGFVVHNRSFFHRPFIELVVVAAPDRRRGIGRQLVRYACSSWPREAVWTATNSSNLPMQALLAALDFTPSGSIENLDADDPELIFRRLPH